VAFRIEKRRELSRYERKFPGRHPFANGETALSACLFLRYLGNANRQKFSVAQQLADVFWCVALKQAFGLLARLIHRNIFERTHFASLVFA
jgi:hypothetical protein